MAEQWVPDDLDPDALAAGIQACRGCELYADATQGVPGEGPLDARVMVVGEQPGDQEDRQGRPFVGPAGRLLDQALEEAGIQRDRAYVTNAVKHFRWKPAPGGGKRRIHQKPDLAHVSACRPWLEGEPARPPPRVVVTLGATAGQALFGSSFRIGTVRGQSLTYTSQPNGSSVTVIPTVHPSAVIRMQGAEREEAYAGPVKDLQTAAALLAAGG